MANTHHNKTSKMILSSGDFDIPIASPVALTFVRVLILLLPVLPKDLVTNLDDIS